MQHYVLDRPVSPALFKLLRSLSKVPMLMGLKVQLPVKQQALAQEAGILRFAFNLGRMGKSVMFQLTPDGAAAVQWARDAVDLQEIIMICGPCGAGKTTLRKAAFKDLPLIDMHRAPRAPTYEVFPDRCRWLEKQLEACKGPRAVVEGIFAHNAASTNHIKDWCAKHHVKITRITVMRALEDCRTARDSDPHRLQLIETYWRRFDY